MRKISEIMKDLKDNYDELGLSYYPNDVLEPDDTKVIYKEIERLNNIINELEKDIKNLYTYGIKNNAEQRDYLLNRLEGLKELKGSDK